METKRVAIFDSQRKLVAIAASVKRLANMMGVSTGTVLRAVKGERIACKGFYIRYIEDDVEMEVEDIGKASLLKFDLDINETDRLIYTTRNQKKSEVILESEFVKIESSKYKRYNYNKNKKK